MKKQTFTSILIVFLFTSALFAQNKKTEVADKLFTRLEYVEAAKEYQKLIDNGQQDDFIYKKLADSYYHTFNISESIIWYKKALQSPQDAETHFRYAQMLKANGDYEASNEQMKLFATLSPDNLIAVEFNKNPNYLSSLKEIKDAYTLKSVSFTSDKSDFGALLNGNTVYFTSARNNSRKIYGWNNEPYLDIYQSTLNDDATFSEPILVDELNSKYHDGPLTVSSDGNTIYFSGDSFRDDLFEKDKKNKVKLSKNSLYRATKSDGKWVNITPLPFNSTSYSVSNPSLSFDGKTLYFSSNMPGSIGGVDIWKVSVDGNQFGQPINLGSKVNTEGDESFPFIAEDNRTLFFASNGKQGFGSYDVFKIDLSTQAEASNLGNSINSSKDDFAFTFNEDKKIGFLSSNRNGNDDIFQVFPICSYDFIVKVSNEDTFEPIMSSKVTLLDLNKNLIETKTSNEKGEVAMTFECDKDFTIVASKDGFESKTHTIKSIDEKKSLVEIQLKPIDVTVTDDEIILKPIYFEFNKSEITSQGSAELDKLVRVMKNNTKLTIFVKSHTDQKGSDSYNLILSEERAKSTVDYIISKGIEKERISGKGFGEQEPIIPCLQCSDEENAKNRRSEFLIVK